MRRVYSALSVAVMAMLGTVSAGELELLAAGASQIIEFAEDLTCGACIVGGYVFCTQGAIVQKCCQPGDQACRADLSCSDQQYSDKF